MRTLVCTEANWDATVGACNASEWVDVSFTLLPPLTAAEGAQIGAAIIACWAIGWGVRQAIRALRG